MNYYYGAIGEQLVLGGAVSRLCTPNIICTRNTMRISCIKAFWQHCRGIQDSTSFYICSLLCPPFIIDACSVTSHHHHRHLVGSCWLFASAHLLTYSLINALERQCPLSPSDCMADARLIAADLKWDEWVGGCWLFYLLVHSFTLFVSGPELKCMSDKCCLWNAI